MSAEQMTWEYLTEVQPEAAKLEQLGKTGWELVGVEGEHFYFKRRGLTFRERVTLEQRSRYYAKRNERDLESGAAS